MAGAPPYSDTKPAPHPPPWGHPCRPHPPQPHDPLSNPQPRHRMSDGQLLCVAAVICCLVLPVFLFFISLLLGPDYPMLKVAGLTVSNLTVTASTGATWKAALLVENSESYGSLLFREVECFVYYRWDTTQPLAAASAEPFALGADGADARTVIKAVMTMERPEVVEDMDQERRSVGTVAVGLGLRMQGTYVLGWWWKKGFGSFEARCDNLKVAFANSTGEGSLVTGDNIATDDNLPSSNLPSCYYGDVD